MTRLVTITERTIDEAAVLVKKGGLVVYPTDTVYGLGCDPSNHDAVGRLVLAKGRKHGRFPLLVSSLEEATRLGRFDKLATELASTFWPGPLTLVVPLASALPEAVTGSTGSVGLRIPARQDTVRLIEKCGGAIVGTSANISGAASPANAAAAMRQLQGRIDLVLDGGESTPRVESSVVKVEGGRLSILRSGALARERILEAARRAGENLSVIDHPC